MSYYTVKPCPDENPQARRAEPWLIVRCASAYDARVPHGRFEFLERCDTRARALRGLANLADVENMRQVQGPIYRSES